MNVTIPMITTNIRTDTRDEQTTMTAVMADSPDTEMSLLMKGPLLGGGDGNREEVGMLVDAVVALGVVLSRR